MSSVINLLKVKALGMIFLTGGENVAWIVGCHERRRYNICCLYINVIVLFDWQIALEGSCCFKFRILWLGSGAEECYMH